MSNMLQECERHEMIGCAICNQSSIEVKAALWAIDDKKRKEVQAAKRAAKTSRRAARRERRKEYETAKALGVDIKDVVRSTDRATYGFKPYKAPEAEFRGQEGLKPHRDPKAVKGDNTDKAPEKVQKPVPNTNYWGWARRDNK